MTKGILNRLSYLQEASFLASVGLLPIQLSKFFWPDFTFVLGLRIDYLAPVLYLSDGAIVILIVSSFARVALKRSIVRREALLLSTLLIVALLVSSAFAKSPQVAYLKTAKIIEFSLFALSISTLSFKKFVSPLTFLFGFSVIWISLLSLVQFARQGSLGLTFLGERTFNISTPGISQVSHQGLLMLRPYATFPHPNVLAAYLSLTLTFILGYLLLSKSEIRRKWFLGACLGLGYVALFLTFSRTSWLSTLLGSVALLTFAIFRQTNRRFAKPRKLVLPVFLGGCVFVLGVFLTPLFLERFLSIATSDSHSLVLRAKLAQAAVSMVAASPFVGVGPGNFLINLPLFWELSETIRWLQPAHNLFLLVFAETGALGFLAFLSVMFFPLFLLLTSKPTGFRFVMLILFSQTAFLAFFDHYFWTLQQGLFLFWLYRGIFLGFAYEQKGVSV